jgi:outer membrane protein TolC
VANAGYRSRDSDLLTNLRAGPNSPITPGTSISSARQASTTDLSLTWSLLDFGQSYYAAKQSGDRVLIASERRRKALNNMVQDVRTAYWRVVAAEKLGQSVRDTMEEAEAALKDSEAAESSAMRSPLEPMRFQRQLLENLRMLELVEHELSSARVELSTLAALPVGSTFNVVEPQAQINTKWLDMNPADMELQAVVNNPEMRESLYNARVARDEAKKAIVKMFPGISFSYGNKSTNDEYIVNQRWNEAGTQISFNLLGILSAPTAKRLADIGISMADQRQVATQMAVISQVHIARLNYANAAKQYIRADKIARVDNRMAEVVASRAKAESQSFV